MDTSETNENYPEAVCDFYLVLSELEVKSTQYLESDRVAHEDHSYAMKWSDTQSTFTQTNKTLTEEKRVQGKIEVGTMSARSNLLTDSDSLLYTGVTREFFFNLSGNCAKWKYI